MPSHRCRKPRRGRRCSDPIGLARSDDSNNADACSGSAARRRLRRANTLRLRRSTRSSTTSHAQPWRVSPNDPYIPRLGSQNFADALRQGVPRQRPRNASHSNGPDLSPRTRGRTADLCGCGGVPGPAPKDSFDAQLRRRAPKRRGEGTRRFGRAGNLAGRFLALGVLRSSPSIGLSAALLNALQRRSASVKERGLSSGVRARVVKRWCSVKFEELFWRFRTRVSCCVVARLPGICPRRGGLHGAVGPRPARAQSVSRRRHRGGSHADSEHAWGRVRASRDSPLLETADLAVA